MVSLFGFFFFLFFRRFSFLSFFASPLLFTLSFDPSLSTFFINIQFHKKSIIKLCSLRRDVLSFVVKVRAEEDNKSCFSKWKTKC